MSLRTLFITTSLLVSAQVVTAFHGHRQDAAVTYLRPELTTVDVVWQSELRQRPQWRGFLAAHGTWWAEFNTANGMPHRAFGEPIPTVGSDPVSRATQFLQNELAMYPLPMDQLSVSAVYPTQKHTYVHFIQVHNGLPVLTGRVMVKLDLQGRVIAFGLDAYASIGISLNPAQGDAASIASASAGLTNIGSVVVSPQLRVLPVPLYRGVEHHLVRVVEVATTENGTPARWECWVDANTGQLLYRQNRVMHHAPPASAGAEITGSSTVFTQNPFIPATLEPLANLRVVVNGVAQYLDPSGYLNTGLGGPISATFFLDGRWSRVETNGSTPSFVTTLQEGANAISFDSGSNTRELSAYHHVNVIHEHVNTWLPTFVGMDFSLLTNVDVAGTCNAFYDGGSINFYEEGGGCQSYAQVAEVVYHEYGHAINDKFYGILSSDFTNGAMNEGYADLWAFTITQDPILADGSSLLDPNDYIRRYDQDPKVYPADIVGEVHADGEIIAGAWWDTHMLLGSDINLTMTLFAEAFPGLQATAVNGNEGQAFRDVLLDVLQADDTDGDLTNGTPNASGIVEAFAIHGITLLSNSQLLHDNLLSASHASPIDLSAQLILDLDFIQYIDEAQLYYRINDELNWTLLPMVDLGGNDYHGLIPAQPRGTVISYCIAMLDIFQHVTGVLPPGALDADPNLPYFTLVGCQLEATEDEDNLHQLGSWQTGVAGDNATSGDWVDGAPIPSYVAPDFLFGLVQTDAQHTPGGSSCFLTGNASGPLSDFGSRDVDGGRTTLRSAPLDLTDRTTPIISYWRWYINDPFTGPNPTADWWQVEVTNDGSTWVPVETTRISDPSWRRGAFRVSDYVAPNSTVQVRFVASDSVRTGEYLDGASIVEAAVDDIQLWDEVDVDGIAESALDLELRIYPDPASDVLNVGMELRGARVVDMRVLDLAGRTVDRPSPVNMIGQERMTVDLSAYSAGSYVLQVITDRGRDERRFSVVR
ncbi:MAG: hypothetical protein IPG10_15630 [Flavobacteriales bacterium]|nr:hypothetical protein [Flavobacteriales bacterium]